MNEIEEKFYKTFGIEPLYIDGCKLADRYWHNEELANEYGTFDQYMKIECPAKYQDCTDECKYAFDKGIYPEITDRILLELLALINDKTLDCIKKQILAKVIGIMSDNPYKIKQVQSLFTEGEE